MSNKSEYKPGILPDEIFTKSKAMEKTTIKGLIIQGWFKLFSKEIRVVQFDSNSRTDGAMGRSDSKLNVIHLAGDLPIMQKEETLIHEMIHLLDAQLGLDLTEKQIMGLSTGFYDFIESNRLTE